MTATKGFSLVEVLVAVFIGLAQLTVSGGTLLVGGNLNLGSGTGTPTFRNALLGVRYSGTFGASLQAEDSRLVFGSSLV